MQSFSEKQIIDIIIQDFTAESSVPHIKSYLQHLHFSKGIDPHIAIKHIRDLFLTDKIPLTYQNLLQKRPKHQALPQNIVLSESTLKMLSDAMGYTPECFSLNLSEEALSNNPWESFRKFISYYCNCIKIEEGATAYSFQNQLNEEFIYLQEHGQWFPKSNGSWQRFIPLSGDAQIRNLWKEGESNRLILGYPVNATCKEDADSWVCAITPIFCYQLDHRITAKGLEITWNGTSPYINLGWLDYAFSWSASARKQFLEVCGLYTPNVDDEQATKQQSTAISFADLAYILTSALSKKICEPLNPTTIRSSPLKEPFSNGIYNRAVVMLAKKSPYSKTLLKELDYIASMPDEVLENTALKHIFNPKITQNETSILPSETVADVLPFNVRQREAIATILSAPLTLLQGPPGTGKSQVVVGTAANARFLGQSVLISSRNHKAIDAIMGRLDPIEEGRPLVIRSNSKDDPNLHYSYAKGIKDMLSEPINLEARTKAGEVMKDLFTRLDERIRIGEKAKNITSIAEQMGEIEESLTHCSVKMPLEWCAYLQSTIKISEEKCSEAIRLLAQCRKQKKPLVASLFSIFGLKNLFTCYWLIQCLKKMKGSTLAFWQIEKDFNLCEAEEFFIRAKEWLTLTKKQNKLEEKAIKLPPLEEITQDLLLCNKRLDAIMPLAISLDAKKRLGIPEGASRGDMDSIRSGLRAMATGIANNSLHAEVHSKLKEQLPLFLNSFPIWAVTSLSVGRFIPLLPAMFDIIIIDEASQSDIPSAIPLLFRAKRAAIIGDPYQLPFITRMKRDKDILLLHQAGLTKLSDTRFAYTDKSLYDATAGSSATIAHILNETYRSNQEIANYSSQLCYNGNLSVCTHEGNLRIPSGKKAGIEWVEIKGIVNSISGGSAFCTEEVEAVIAIVYDLLVQKKFKGSVGIVTPFRQQANRIHDAIYDSSNIPFEVLQQVQMHVDTVHGFQGDERDVMLFSLCAGSDMSPGALSFLRENSHIFNVAVSRARALLQIIGNREWAQHSSIRHIEMLTRTKETVAKHLVKGQWHPYESPWEKKFAEALIAEGLDVKAQFPVRNRRLDLAMILPDAKCKMDIEVDGDCHRNSDGSRKSDDYWRDIEMQALGWKVCRFWTYQLREDMNSCVKRVKTEWNEMVQKAIHASQ